MIKPRSMRRTLSARLARNSTGFSSVRMTYPADVGVIDLMLGIPEGSKKHWYGFLRAGFMDEESKEMAFPAQYMFKDVPADVDPEADPIAVVLGEMDHFGIDKAMVGI